MHKELREKLERDRTMKRENTKEFRIRDYVHAFEKSLNYLTGAILAILVAGISYISSVPEWDMTVFEIVQKIHDDPKIFLCIFTAVLATLPYYFYYTLKDNDRWNACQGERDKWGLGKLCIIYELCMMCLFYLLVQGDMRFAEAKCYISGISAGLSLLYLYLMIKGNYEEERIGYFVLIILGVIGFFILLLINSLYNLKDNLGIQNYSVVCLLLSFVLNAAINTCFLSTSDSNEEMGIISNRKKIMIPIISISVYTVTVIFCFYYFSQQCWIMLATALVITMYEVAISCIKWQDNRKKVGACIIAFIALVIIIPMCVWKNEKYPNELALNWLILIGISIYLAAIKYWGYILKWLFYSREHKESKAKAMNTMVWFRNSILGSMLYILVILLSSGSYHLLLLTIIICSLTSEKFISYYVFADQIENRDKVYKTGRIIEFFAIMLPVVFFVLEKRGVFKWEWEPWINIEIPSSMIFCVSLLGCILLCGYIRKEWRVKEGTDSQIMGFQEEELPEIEERKLLKKLLCSLEKIKALVEQTTSWKNAGSFLTLTLSWCVYIVLTAAFLDFSPAVSYSRIWGAIGIVFIVIMDWCFLSRRLTDYYIKKLKMGERTVKFLKYFKIKWDENLKTMLAAYKEIDAQQFQEGSRLRPLLFYMGSSYRPEMNIGEEEYNNIAQAACSLEMIHKASVMFDDFIDGDEKRHEKPAYHVQYPDIHKLLLLGNAMLAYAQVNFVNCKPFFRCSEAVMIENIKNLSKIVTDLCEGCYKELSRADYERQDRGEIDNIIKFETVSLIEGSIALGYSCFHTTQGDEERVNIEKLGEVFAYIFQYLNDLEPFSQKEKYKKYKGSLDHYDHGKKNIALVTLYHCASAEDKAILKEGDYEKTEQLYRKYNIEQEILGYVREKIDELVEILGKLEAGNQEWVESFKELFNMALAEKGWKEKIAPL